MCFEAVSGLKVDVGKSEIVPVGVVDVPLAEVLGCKVNSFPSSYLGLTLVQHSKSKPVTVVERFQKRLAG